MTVTQNSLKAYFEIINEGLLSKREKQVYEIISSHPAGTDKEYSQLLCLPIDCVTPRRKSLEEKGLIHSPYSRNCNVTGRTAKVWKLGQNPQKTGVLEDKKKESGWIKLKYVDIEKVLVTADKVYVNEHAGEYDDLEIRNERSETAAGIHEYPVFILIRRRKK